MSQRAQITSIEAISSFRAGLVTYLETARPILEEVVAEVVRVRAWLEQDRLRFWERELRRRDRLLREAEDVLRTARMSSLRETTQAEADAVRKARAAFEQARDRLQQVKRWCRNFDSRVSPVAHQLGSLQTLLATDMPRAVASLTRTLDLLAEYAEIVPSPGLPPPVPTAPASDAEPTPSGGAP
ncbi:MAG: hypothetical protein J0L84_06010 [Verrucomicrobia bacterium]|nr:hypothetical protein [Verrucomicrobiota bacterium]